MSLLLGVGICGNGKTFNREKVKEASSRATEEDPSPRMDRHEKTEQKDQRSKITVWMTIF